MRIVFMGTPDFAVASLRRLVEGGYNVVAVVTMCDKPAGRGCKMCESAVKQYTVSAGLPVLQPEKLKDPAFLEQLQSFEPDLGIVIAFRMLPEAVWAMPRLGTFNLHASLLPQYRGAAPINWAVINGETVTGVTTFMLNREIDKGAILGRAEVAIGPDENAGSLHDRLMETGSHLVLETVEKIAAGDVDAEQQPQSDAGLKPAPKIFREDCLIRWDGTPEQIHNFVRGLSPYPAAWAYMTERSPVCVTAEVNERGERTGGECPPAAASAEPVSVKILAVRPEPEEHSAAYGTIKSDGKSYLKVACRGGWIEVLELQPAGRRRMKADEFLCGVRDISHYGF